MDDELRLAALGRTPFGRGDVKLEWEVKALGTSFDGTSTVKSSSWQDSGTSGYAFSELVNTLTDNTVYHWRVRFLYNPVNTPLQPHSRWFSGGSNGWEEADFRTELIPAEDDGSWTQSSAQQQNNADTNAVDIKNSGNTKLEYQSDDDHFYFQYYLEADPVEASYTYSVLLDTNTDGTYDYCIASYGETDSVSLYKWSGSDWDNSNVKIMNRNYFNFDDTLDVVQFAVAKSDIGNPSGTPDMAIVTYDEEADAFEDSGNYETTNAPVPGASEGDTTIPEFGDLFVPIIAMIGLFVVFRRKRKK